MWQSISTPTKISRPTADAATQFSPCWVTTAPCRQGSKAYLAYLPPIIRASWQERQQSAQIGPAVAQLKTKLCKKCPAPAKRAQTDAASFPMTRPKACDRGQI